MTLIPERSDTPPPPCAVSLSAAARAAVFGLATLLDSEVYELLVLQAAYLEQKHGEAYAEYKAKVPRLVPNVAGIGALLEAAFGGDASSES